MVSPWILRLLNSLFSSLFLAFLIPLGGRRGGLDYAVGVPILGTRSFASARPAHATEQIAFEPQNESKRPVTVADAIEMTKIAGSPARPIAQFAPNGKKFVLVVTKGNIKRNSNEYSLLLWSTSDLSDSAAPKTILTMSSTSNRPGIQELTWMDDNDTVAFLGENPGELQQLYTFNIKTRLLRRITDQPTNVIAYSMTPKGDTIAYVAEEPVVSIFNARAQRQGVRVSRQYLRELL